MLIDYLSLIPLANLPFRSNWLENPYICYNDAHHRGHSHNGWKLYRPLNKAKRRLRHKSQKLSRRLNR